MSAAATALPAGLREAVIHWQVVLASGEVSEAEASAFARWLKEPAHQQAWQQQAGGMAQAFAGLRQLGPDTRSRAETLCDVLTQQQRQRRRVMQGLLGIAAGGTALAWLAQDTSPLRPWLAAYRTGTGERRQVALADGSQLWLNARSAVDVVGDGTGRQVRLHQGEVLVDVQPGNVPFVLETWHGAVRSLAGRLLVRQTPDAVLVAALQGDATVAPTRAAAWTLQAGQSVWFDALGPQTRTAPPAATLDAWSRGRLAVQDQPLAEVVQALADYHPQRLRVHPAVAQLRVVGVYPLDAPAQALSALTQTLPVQVQPRWGGLWLEVGPL